MKKFFPLVIAMMLVHIALLAQTNPAITSWKVNTNGTTGYRGYETNVRQVFYSNTSVYIRTNSIPSYMPFNAGPPNNGPNDWWPNNPWFPDSMGYTFRIRLTPTPNTGTLRKPPYGHIGVWSNGVSIYNPLDAKSWNTQNIWFQNAYYFEHLLAETFDPCWGHANQSFEYHTHQSPECLYNQADSLNHSPLLGFAFDYYPIYGCYGHRNSNGTGGIKRMKSSYRMRNITDRTTLPDGTVLPTNQQGPPLSTYPIGAYQEDFEFVPGLGDLDIHNGRFSITPEYPNGTYAYFVTLDDTLAPVYPYVIGQTYYGNVISTDGNMGPNSGYVTINEAVNAYVPVTSGTEEIASETTLQVFPNPVAGQINFVLSSEKVLDDCQGSIYDQSGRLIESGRVYPNSNNAFNTTLLPAGMYYLRITTGQEVYTQKFIVAK